MAVPAPVPGMTGFDRPGADGGGIAGGAVDGGLDATGGADGSAGAGIAVVPPPPGTGNGRGVYTAPLVAQAANDPATITMTTMRAIDMQYRRLLPNCVVLRDSWHNGA